MQSFESFENFETKGIKKINFPINAFPDVLKNYCIEVSKHVQVPVDMVASAVIGIMAVCLQSKFYIEPQSGWVEPLNLYVLIAANPSERKTPVLKEVSGAVNQYVNRVNKELKPQRDRYLAEKNILSNKIDQLTKDVSHGKKTVTIDDVLKVRDELDNLEEVKLLRMIVDDITPEALVSAMKENDEVISIVTAEGGIFGMLSGRYSNQPNMDLFLKAYSGEAYHTDRIGREYTDLDNPLMTIVVMLQPVVLKDAVENKQFRERGLMSRFLYVIPNSIIGKRTKVSEPINEAVKNEYNKLVNDLLDINTKRGFNTRSNIIRLSHEADKIDTDFYNDVECKILNEYGSFEDWAGKYRGQVMRIAGILHCVKYQLNAPNVLLEADTMQAALDIGKFFLEQTKYVFEDLRDDDDIVNAKCVLNRIIKIFNASSLKTLKILKTNCRELQQKCKGKINVDDFKCALNILEKRGYIKQIERKPQGGGRPTVDIYVNPRVFEREERKWQGTN